jgi:predicted RecA/RadA family phage recombinase
MAQNFVGPGHVLEHEAAGPITSGQPVALGDGVVGVALGTVAAGESVSVQVTGRWTLPKTEGTAWNQGDALDWDASQLEFTKLAEADPGDILGCAFAAADAAADAVTGEVRLANPARNAA